MAFRVQLNNLLHEIRFSVVVHDARHELLVFGIEFGVVGNVGRKHRVKFREQSVHRIVQMFLVVNHLHPNRFDFFHDGVEVLWNLVALVFGIQSIGNVDEIALLDNTRDPKAGRAKLQDVGRVLVIVDLTAVSSRHVHQCRFVKPFPHVRLHRHDRLCDLLYVEPGNGGHLEVWSNA